MWTISYKATTSVSSHSRDIISEESVCIVIFGNKNILLVISTIIVVKRCHSLTLDAKWPHSSSISRFRQQTAYI